MNLVFVLGGILLTWLLLRLVSRQPTETPVQFGAYRPIFYRRIHLVAFPSFLAGLFIISLLYLNHSGNNKTRYISELKKNVLGVRSSVESSLNELHSDVIYLSRVAGSLVTDSSVFDTKTLTRLFIDMAETVRLYDQIRILDTNGMEVLRVNYSQGKAVRIPDDELQNKSGRGYFVSSRDLVGDQVYVSEVGLNEERGEVEIPYKPVMRAISPLYGPGGNKLGFVVINYLPSALFNKFTGRNYSDFHYLFLDSDGNILAGAEPYELYGFALEQARNHSFNNTHASVWNASRGNGEYLTGDDESFIWSKILLSNLLEEDYTHPVHLHEGSIPEINLAGVIPNEVLWWEMHRHISLYFLSLLIFTFFSAVILTIANKKELLAYLERAKFEGVFNKSFQFIGLLDPSGTILEFNETALAFSQTSKDRIVGKKFWELPWWKHNSGAAQRIYDAVLSAQTGNFSRFDTQIENLKGTLAVDFSIRPIFNANGSVQFLLPELRDISQLLSMQEALRETNTLFEDIKRKAGIGIWRLDMRDHSMHWSRQIYKILGEIQGTTANLNRSLEKLHPEDRTEFLECLEDLKNGASGFDKEMRVIVSDGSIRWVRVTGNPVIENDELREVRGIFIDIDNSKQQQVALADTAHRLILATQAAQIGIWEWDAEKRQMYWDNTMYHIHDVSSATFEVSYANWLPLIHPDDVDRFAGIFESTDPQAHEFAMSYVIVTPAQEKRHVQTLGSIEFGRNGKLIRVIGVSMDITEEKTAQERIQQLNRELEQKVEERTESLRKTTIELEQQLSLFDLTTIISITDKEGIITDVNSTFCEISGYTREELIGRNHRILKSGKQPDGMFVGMWAVLKAGKTWTGEICNKRKDGTFYWVQTIIAPFFDENGEIDRFVSARFDITARKNAEQDLKKKTRELASINKRLDLTNQELETFSYSVSHDLKAPLRALEGFSKNLLIHYSGSLDETGKRWLNFIESNAVQMDRLIDDILSFSRIGKKEIKKSLVNMNALVEKLIEREKLTNTRELEIEISDLPNAACDHSLIEMVWQNLIGNAFKYSSGKELIHIEIRGWIDSNMVWYEVKDNGSGFDMRHYDKLFGLFQRLHDRSEFEGAGVGLASVKRILAKHDGFIEAESSPGNGATFRFCIPLNYVPKAQYHE